MFMVKLLSSSLVLTNCFRVHELLTKPIKVAINHLRAPPLFEAIQTHDAIDMRFNAHRT